MYIYISTLNNFECRVQMSKHIFKKPRHLFTKKLYFGFFQTFKASKTIYIYIYVVYISNKLLNFYIRSDIFKILKHLDIGCVLYSAYYTIAYARLHLSIKVLKALRFPAVLILKDRAFQILGP